MIMTICDRCKKEIKGDRFYFQWQFGEIEDFEKTDLCEDCFRYVEYHLHLLLEITDTDKTIAGSNMSIRTKNALLRYLGYNNLKNPTIGDLIKLSIADLVKIRNLGKKSAHEVVEYVHDLGLKFRGESEETLGDQLESINEESGEEE